ncbi:transmembrane protein 220 isoform X1 [Neopsephotus bourkii]|uniref:transmembrane protein 220 isoform X1 n=1 Tax=Neopsephotus bourkii TaxID=309878 RepID=UPI002AA55D7A|nr:transmembrane protein 220 isoform X1 [Neopsephotus bourkii]
MAMAGRLWRGCNLLMAAFFGLAAAVQVRAGPPGGGRQEAPHRSHRSPPHRSPRSAAPAGSQCAPSAAGERPRRRAVDCNRVWRSLCDLHSAGCIIGTIALACSLFAYAQGNILHEEEGRELFGLVIIAVWMRLCRSSAKNPLAGVHLTAAVAVTLFPFVSWLYIYVNKEMRESWPTHCKTVI